MLEAALEASPVESVGYNNILNRNKKCYFPMEMGNWFPAKGDFNV